MTQILGTGQNTRGNETLGNERILNSGHDHIKPFAAQTSPGGGIPCDIGSRQGPGKPRRLILQFDTPNLESRRLGNRQNINGQGMPRNLYDGVTFKLLAQLALPLVLANQLLCCPLAERLPPDPTHRQAPKQHRKTQNCPPTFKRAYTSCFF